MKKGFTPLEIAPKEGSKKDEFLMPHGKEKVKTPNFLTGFTLVEMIVVIGIIAILAALSIVAINAGHQKAKSRNSQRKMDVNIILNAVVDYAADNNGQLPATITGSDTEICKTGGSCGGLIDLGVLTASQKYVASLPSDPKDASANGTGYNISKNANGRVTVSAPHAEESESISVTR